MAYQEYNETQSLNDMTTRQLRLYISEKSTEAQKRIDTMDLKKAPRALQDQAFYITDRSGTHVKRSTSNMSKAEMVEYAYQLREFNMLDTTSKHSRDIEWVENKARYENFIRNTQNPNKNPYYSEKFANYWKQFILPSGRISKKGYKEYKRYIEFIRAVGKEKEKYGYRELKADAVKLLENSKRFKAINNMLNDVFMGNTENLSVEKMVERVDTMVAIYDERAQARLKRQSQNKIIKKVAAKATKPKTKTTKKTNTVKTKTAGKMKTNATIRERIN